LRYWAATRLYNFDGRALRKQYYFRESERGLLAWDVDRLCELSRGLPRKSIPLKNIRELDQPCGGEGASLTWRPLRRSNSK